MSEYYNLINETEKYRHKELQAAVKIEALWRMFKQRKLYLHQKWAVSVIKRVYRGYRTRKSFWKLTSQALALQRRLFFSSLALSIQRIYRGFYSRKKDLKYIEGKNQRRLEKMNKYKQDLVSEDQKRQEDYARMEFYKLSTNLHHLTSTNAIPGVYKSLEAVSDFGKHSLKTH